MTEATTMQLSDTLGVSVRQIDRLAARGVLIRTKRGKFDLDASAQNFIKHREAEAARLAQGRVAGWGGRGRSPMMPMVATGCVPPTNWSGSRLNLRVRCDAWSASPTSIG